MFNKNKNNSDKIRVVVLKQPRNEERLITPHETSDGETIFIMRQATDKSAGWHFSAPEGSIRHDQQNKPYVEVYPGGEKAIVITGEQVVAPRFGKDQSKEFITVLGLLTRFKKMAQEFSSIKMLLIIAVVVGIIAIAVSGYSVYMGNQTQDLVKQALGMMGNITRNVNPGGVVG